MGQGVLGVGADGLVLPFSRQHHPQPIEGVMGTEAQKDTPSNLLEELGNLLKRVQGTLSLIETTCVDIVADSKQIKPPTMNILNSVEKERAKRIEVNCRQLHKSIEDTLANDISEAKNTLKELMHKLNSGAALLSSAPPAPSQ
jgi:hypothetical protein